MTIGQHLQVTTAFIQTQGHFNGMWTDMTTDFSFKRFKGIGSDGIVGKSVPV